MCGIRLDAEHKFNKNQKSSHVGKRFKSKKSGWFEVVEGDFENILIRFDDTGNKRVVSASVAVNGQAKDFYAPSILGVACIGNARKVDATPQYKMWHHIIDRCYNPKEPYYSIYGGAGVTVSDRWLVFEHFLEDFRKIERIHPPGHQGLLEIDKDLKQLETPPHERVYSLETCALVSKDINQLCRTSSIFFNAFHEDGVVETHYNANLFIHKYPYIGRTGIHNCLNPNKPQEIYKGWRFEKVEPTNEVIWDLVDKLNTTEETEWFTQQEIGQ